MGDGCTTSACPGDEDNVRPERTGRVIGPGGFDSRVTPSEPTAVFDVIEPVLTTGHTYWALMFPAMLLYGRGPDFVYLAAQVIASK
ncbi:hypothetical protein MY3296_002332 [Beauveria thailandica]